MDVPIEPRLVSQLALLAGFHFSPDRCEVLAPQLDWLIIEAGRIRDLPRQGLEPLGIFRPANAAAPQAREEVAGRE